MSEKALNLLIRPMLISTPFVKATFGGVEFGLSSRKNTFTNVLASDFITGLSVKKYGSGAVNTYTLTLKYVITPESDPNYVDLVLSRATDRKIFFTYGDLAKPDYSYKEEQAIITSVKPNVDYKNNTIVYTITATSSTTLSYSLKRTFEETRDKPSNILLKTLYDPKNGLIDVFKGMANRDDVISRGWIPTDDSVVAISEKKDVSPLDYILYLVSLMKGTSGSYYTLKIIDGGDGSTLPHFRVTSTSLKDKSKMMVITVGYPGSVPVYDLQITQNTSTSLMVEYRDNIDPGIYQDYSFRGDLISENYYSDEVVGGHPSDNLKNWWKKMEAFPLNASIRTDGLYLPAEIVQSVYLDIYFFGKKYNHSGEYLIINQEDSITSQGYFTTLGLMRIDNVQG